MIAVGLIGDDPNRLDDGGFVALPPPEKGVTAVPARDGGAWKSDVEGEVFAPMVLKSDPDAGGGLALPAEGVTLSVPMVGLTYFFSNFSTSKSSRPL